MRYLLAIYFLLGIDCSITVAAEKTKILLVGAKPDHPWGSHMYRFETRVLASCLQKTEGVEAHVIAAWPPAPNQLAGIKSIVFYSSPAGEVVLADQHRDQFLEQMKQGVGFVAIHWGTGVGYGKLADRQDIRNQYQAVLGGWFRRPPCDVATGVAQLTALEQGHPIMRGWEPWKIRDEFYLNPVLDKEAKPLLKVNFDGKDHVVGWTFHRKTGGRSLGITLGHFHDNFARDDFRRMLVNGILWSANVEIPETGAAVHVDPEQLKLPPEKKP